LCSAAARKPGEKAEETVEEGGSWGPASHSKDLRP
jgi:hypothetical protein